MKIYEIEAYFQNLYPKERSCPWDHDGLQICHDREKEVSRILTCLDVTFSAIEEAKKCGCELIVSHHPLIFSPIDAINEDSVVGQKIHLMIEGGICLLSLHTRFDGAVGGLNERFGRTMGILHFDERVLLPEEPYIGKIGYLTEKISPQAFAERVSSALEVPVKLYSAELDVHCVGFCCGSGKDLVAPSLELGADVFVGGDIPYHVALDAVERGMSIVDCGHHGSEKQSPVIFAEDLQLFSTELVVHPFAEPLGGEIVKFY